MQFYVKCIFVSIEIKNSPKIKVYIKLKNKLSSSLGENKNFRFFPVRQHHWFYLKITVFALKCSQLKQFDRESFSSIKWIFSQKSKCHTVRLAKFDCMCRRSQAYFRRRLFVNFFEKYAFYIGWYWKNKMVRLKYSILICQ